MLTLLLNFNFRNYGSKRIEMKQIHILILSLFILPVLISGCSTTYVSPASFAPLMDEKGDVKIRTAMGLNSLHGNIAYALTDNIAITATGNTEFHKRSTKFFNYIEVANKEHNYLETGLGYFGNIRRFQYEVYSGFGIGNSMMKNEKIDLSGQYEKYFTQINLGFKFKRNSYSETGGSIRYSYNEYLFSGYESNYDSDDLRYSSERKYFSAIGAHLFFRTGVEKFMFEVNPGVYLYPGNIPLRGAYKDVLSIHLSLGLSINLNVFNKSD